MGRHKGSKNKPQETKNPSAYFVTLSVSGKTYSTTGNTLIEAIGNLHPELFKTKGILTVRKGEKEVTRILWIRQMKKLFGEWSSLSKEIALTSTAKFLDVMLT